MMQFCPQAYDLIELEPKALGDFTDEELAGAPLLFLGCGHTFPLDSLDGVKGIELHTAYERGAVGWTKLLPLQVLRQYVPSNFSQLGIRWHIARRAQLALWMQGRRAPARMSCCAACAISV